MSVSVDIVTKGIDLATAPAECKRRQELYARRCAFVMRKYVPVRETILRSSEPVNSDYGAGILTWNTPYAARQYYEPMRHTCLLYTSTCSWTPASRTPRPPASWRTSTRSRPAPRSAS